jgi:hypothetical protein
MTSTRSRNTLGDYQLEQALNRGQLNYKTYQGRIMVRDTLLPGVGLKPARLPMQVDCDLWDIESELRGIGSTNLVNPKTTTLLPPEPKGWRTLNIYEQEPVILPRPLEIPADARYDMRA